MKIGDRVRFLSEKGGGRVAGFQGKNIVLVEDEDGFDVPMAVSEVVVIGEENYDTSHIVEVKQLSRQAAEPKEQEPADRPVTFKAEPQERKGGEAVSAYLAFVPIDVKELSNTRFEAYFVNDSNYYIRFTYLSAEGSAWQLRHTEEVEPNTKVFIEEFGREDLQQMERVALQLMPYKRRKPFMLKPVLDVRLRIDGVKFFKLHTFQENDFFEQPALIYTLVENDRPVRPLFVDPRELALGAAVASRQADSEGKTAKAADDTPTTHVGAVVVDLHASELLDTTAGMSPSDILNYQLDVFRRTLKNYEKKKGTRIIFIHGKGEGVLRKALVNELQYRYKSYTYQDASFREYGYGATQVTIK
jgi:hypothetical protein